MGKKQKQGHSQTKSKQSKAVFGRPQDDPIQTFFMTKLRNNKLQVINAQSEAELALYDFHDQNPQIYSALISKNEEDKLSNSKIVWIRSWFHQIDPNKYELLWRSFRFGAEKYQFIQINDQKDFPEYLFCDYCDLSYILNEALHSDIPELRFKTQFSSDELFFLELICFASRDMISFQVLKAFRRNYQPILNQMVEIKNKINQHYQITNQKEADQSRNNDLFLDLGLEKDNSKQQKERQSQIEEMQPEKSNDQKFTFKKRRIIKRASRQRGRPARDNQIKVVPEQQLSPEQINMTLHKLLIHIAWAYRYILPEEIKKKKAFEENQS